MPHTVEIDRLQTKFQCCGLDSYQDWKSTDAASLQAISKYEQLISRAQLAFDVPDTCCRVRSDGCGKNFRARATINVRGCSRPFLTFLSARVFFVACLVLGIAGIDILAVVYMIAICVILRGDYNAPIFLAEVNSESEEIDENESLQVKELDW